MKITSIISLAIFGVVAILQTLVIAISPSDLSGEDKIMLSGTIGGVCLSLTGLFLKKYNALSISLFLLVSVFVQVVMFKQTNYWFDYYKDNRGDYSLYFIILYGLCLFSIILLSTFKLRKVYLAKTADTSA